MNGDSISPEEYEELRDEFIILLNSRLAAGEEEYGELAFMYHNTFREMYEELADLANWAMFTFVRLRVMERGLPDAIRRQSEGD